MAQLVRGRMKFFIFPINENVLVLTTQMLK